MVIQNEKDGIVEVTTNNSTYKCWKVEYIRPYIVRFLKENFPNSLITFETNNIDLVIFKGNDIIPVEIQKSIIQSNGSFGHSQFEKEIEKQLHDNIENYDKCWLFFDSEYLRCLQSYNVGKNISINMNWLVEYMKIGKLRVYTIRYNGTVEELSSKDFDFLKDISMTCPLGSDRDMRILNRNKLKIFVDVIRYYNFTQDEIDRFDHDYEKYRSDNSNNEDKNDQFSSFLMKKSSEREKLYGNILYTIGFLELINRVLDMDIDDKNVSKAKVLGSHIGIFDIEGHSSGSITLFVDRIDICNKYFPGYLRNRDTWNKLKGHKLNARQFEDIVRKKTDINKGVDYFWYETYLSKPKITDNRDNK